MCLANVLLDASGPPSRGARMDVKMYSRMSAKLIVSAIALTMVAVALSPAAPNASAEWTGSWDTETPMGAAASQSVVVSGLDGTVYVMGGVSNIGYGTIGDSYSYDPDTGDWTVLASMPYPERGAAGAVGLDGRVYVFGGDDSIGRTQIYDPDTDAWSDGATMLDWAWEAKAAMVTDGSMWVVGGEGPVEGGYVQIYDPVADSWSEGPAAPAAVLCGSLVAMGDDLYYSGGCVGDYTGTTQFYKYDSAEDEWVSLAALPAARAAHASVVGVDGLLYVIGGSDNGWNTGSTAPMSSTIVYDPATDEWASSGNMDYARKYLGAVVTGDGRIMAFGGNTLAAVLDVVESMQLYLFDYSVALSSSSVRAGESLLLLADAEFTYIEEHSSEIGWALVSADDGTYYGGEYVWSPTAAPMALSIDVPSAAPAGDYLVLIVYWLAYADVAYEYLSDIELELEVLPAADPADMLIADLEAQIADLEAQLAELNDSMAASDAALAADIAALEDALAALEASVGADNQALMDEIAALQDQVDALQSSLDSADTTSDGDDTMTFAIIGLLVVVIVLLLVMMVMGRKEAPPPPAQ